MIMGLISRLVIMAHQYGKPIQGIFISSPKWSGRKITAHIEFNSLLVVSHGMWGGKSDLRDYVGSKARHMSMVFDKNPRILHFFTELVQMIDSFCETKRIPFADVKLEKSVITPDNVLMVSVSTDHLNKWER